MSERKRSEEKEERGNGTSVYKPNKQSMTDRVPVDESNKQGMTDRATVYGTNGKHGTDRAPMYAIKRREIVDVAPMSEMNEGQLLLERTSPTEEKKREEASLRRADRARRFFALSLVFFSVSFAGWCLEVVYCSSGFKNFHNRGFLTLPFCVIYGTPLCLVYLFLGTPQEGRLKSAFERSSLKGGGEVVLRYASYFILSALLATAFELVFGFLFERLGDPLWNYSDMPLNFRGYVCLAYSLAWGALITLAMSIFFLPLYKAFLRLPTAVSIFVSGFLWVAVTLDFGLNFTLLLLRHIRG